MRTKGYQKLSALVESCILKNSEVMLENLSTVFETMGTRDEYKEVLSKYNRKLRVSKKRSRLTSSSSIEDTNKKQPVTI